MDAAVKGMMVLLFLVVTVIVIKSQYSGHDPYQVCNKKETAQERKQCRNMVDFALSAGW